MMLLHSEYLQRVYACSSDSGPISQVSCAVFHFDIRLDGQHIDLLL